MEIELKYNIDSSELAEAIWSDEELQQFEEEDTRECEPFNGTYYDTNDYILFRNYIAFRIREEGPKLVASLKWNGKSDGGLHKREELNIHLLETEKPENPAPDIFAESEEGKDVVRLVGDKTLVSMMDVNMTRRSFRIDYNGSVMEISIDSGEIIANEQHRPICELEIELFSGSEEDLMRIGDLLSDKYNLVPEQASKFSKGLSMLGLV